MQCLFRNIFMKISEKFGNLFCMIFEHASYDFSVVEKWKSIAVSKICIV